MNDVLDVSRIRDLNDALRRTLTGGTLMMTAGVVALGAGLQMRILAALSAFDSFDDGNDPHREHDFGAFEVEGVRLFFKIDTYDRSLTSHSPDPADASVTARVLTLMLPEEY